MKKLALLVVLVAVVVGGAYYFWGANRTTVQVALSTQNASGETGMASLREVNGNIEVTLTLTGQPGGEPQPAHIHKGTCPTPGTVLSTLTFPKDGYPAVTTLQGITLADLEAMGPLAINVHKSGAELSVYVACGNIVF